MPGRKIRDTVEEDVIPNTDINFSIRIQEILSIAMKTSIPLKASPFFKN